MRKTLFIFIIFYILILLQTSFLVYFNIKGFIPNFILIAIILINFFEEREKNTGIYSALIGGFFLDIFSEKFFGLYILISITIAIFIKYIIKRYVQIPFFRRT
jgi:rod shape-determining protein MreD